MKTTPPLLSIMVPEGTEAFLPLDELQENAHGASNHLKATLRATGQRDPILVQRLPDGTYRIRDGNRRVAAARSLLWTDIRALIYDDLGEDAWALIIAGVHNRSENPVEEARLYQRLLQTLTIEGIAANTGVLLQVIRARLSLLDLPDDILDLVGTRVLALSIAERAAKLKGPYLLEAIRQIRVQAQGDQAFTAKHLKDITVVRSTALGARLLAAAPPPPTLIPPADVLAMEVKELCERRKIPVADLLQVLGQSDATASTSAPTTRGSAARAHLN